MKRILNVGIRIVIALGLWVIGNLLVTQVKASGDPEVQGYTTCTARNIQDYHRECGNQVNGQCSTVPVVAGGGWYDSYYTQSDCIGNSSTYDGCKSSLGNGTETDTWGDCFPVQGGDPPVCQPGPSHVHINDKIVAQCSEADPPGSHDPTLARDFLPSHRLAYTTLVARR